MTSCGLNNGPLVGKGCYEARIACNLSGKNGMVKSDEAKKKDKKMLLPYFTQSGVDREENGDQYIANMQDGAWCGFKYFAFDGTESSLKVMVRASGEGVLKVSTERGGKPAAEVAVKPCGGWMNFEGAFASQEGTAPLYFTYEGSGKVDFKSFEIQ